MVTNYEPNSLKQTIDLIRSIVFDKNFTLRSKLLEIVVNRITPNFDVNVGQVREVEQIGDNHDDKLIEKLPELDGK